MRIRIRNTAFLGAYSVVSRTLFKPYWYRTYLLDLITQCQWTVLRMGNGILGIFDPFSRADQLRKTEHSYFLRIQ